VPEDLSVAYMYNPFTGQTFRSAMGRLFDSYDRHPRPLRIMYGYPVEHDWLVSTGRVVVEDVSSCFWPPRPRWWRRGNVLVTYRVVPRGPETVPPPGRGHATRPSQALQYWSKANGLGHVVEQTDGVHHLAPHFESRP
jgi:hypothetical protein